MSGIRYQPGILYSGLGSIGNSNPENDTMKAREDIPGLPESNKGGGFMGFLSKAGKFLSGLGLNENEREQRNETQKDNTALYVSIGFASLIVLIVVIYLVTKKK